MRVLGECPLGEVAGNDRQFMLGNETMDCAPGTMFNLSLCTCVRYEPCTCYYLYKYVVDVIRMNVTFLPNDNSELFNLCLIPIASNNMFHVL